jgi:hypothetical protein
VGNWVVKRGPETRCLINSWELRKRERELRKSARELRKRDREPRKESQGT